MSSCGHEEKYFLIAFFRHFEEKKLIILCFFYLLRLYRGYDNVKLNYNLDVIYSLVPVCLFHYVGAKLSWCQIVRLPSWCQIVRFYYIGAKLSYHPLNKSEYLSSTLFMVITNTNCTTIQVKSTWYPIKPTSVHYC